MKQWLESFKTGHPMGKCHKMQDSLKWCEKSVQRALKGTDRMSERGWGGADRYSWVFLATACVNIPQGGTTLWEVWDVHTDLQSLSLILFTC